MSKSKLMDVSIYQSVEIPIPQLSFTRRSITSDLESYLQFLEKRSLNKANLSDKEIALLGINIGRTVKVLSQIKQQQTDVSVDAMLLSDLYLAKASGALLSDYDRELVGFPPEDSFYNIGESLDPQYDEQ